MQGHSNCYGRQSTRECQKTGRRINGRKPLVMVLEILLVVITIVVYMVLFELWVQYIVKQPVDEDFERLVNNLIHGVDISESEE